MRSRSQVGAAVIAVTAVAALLASGVAGASTGGPRTGSRTVLASTAPTAGPYYSGLAAMSPTSRVRVSVFTGRDQSGLAAEAATISVLARPERHPTAAGRDYRRFLSPAQVRARFGATTGQQAAVAGWLAHSGLRVTGRTPFTVTATGTTAQAESAVAARLELSHPRGSIAQVVSAGPMSVPSALARFVGTVRVAPAAVPMGQPEPMKKIVPTVPAGTAPKAAAKLGAECSAYYGQKRAGRLPAAYGHTLTWAPCGYLPQQLREAYGAARAGLTGRGVSVAILSEDNDSTAASDANRWARARGFPPFGPGQFAADIATNVPDGIGDGESALDVESVHGMAPAARVSYVAGNGSITGDRLLDSLDTVVSHGLASVVSSSWYDGYMPAPKSLIDAWETVLERAAVEGITVNFATGDDGDQTPLQYPGSDPWVTAVGGTSLAIGAGGAYQWETGWETDETGLNQSGMAWHPAPPGGFAEGSTGGVSQTFPEPYYQDGVVSGNTYKGKAMRAVPDVSDLGDWNLGYQVGLSVQSLGGKLTYVNEVNGGTSLSAPMFTGFEADLIQGRGGIPLGFANPALYDMAGTAAFHDVTGDPRGQGVTEADVYGPAYQQPPSLSTMGQCAVPVSPERRPTVPVSPKRQPTVPVSPKRHPTAAHLSCGPGYDTVTGLGSPGPAFFSSFGSRPR